MVQLSLHFSDDTLDGKLDALQQQISGLTTSLTDALERIDFALQRIDDFFEATQGIE